jgi:hypothetical protein
MAYPGTIPMDTRSIQQPVSPPVVPRFDPSTPSDLDVLPPADPSVEVDDPDRDSRTPLDLLMNRIVPNPAG